MSGFLRGSATVAVILGLGGGALALLGVQGAYHYTSTDDFCSNSCHSMQTYVAGDPHFAGSRHRSPPSGIRISCSDCHVPPSFPAKLVYKAKSGIRDIYEELTSDFSDPATWEARRADLANKVRDWYVTNDSAPCRACHTPEKLRPERESGQRQHELAERKGVTCIGCHYNLVHQPVEPTQDLVAYGRVSANMTRLTDRP